MLSEGKLAESDYAQISTEIASLESQIATLEQDAKTLTTTYQHANDELKKLKDAEKNVKKARETAMKDLESNMKKSAKTASQVTQHNPLYQSVQISLQFLPLPRFFTTSLFIAHAIILILQCNSLISPLTSSSSHNPSSNYPIL